MSPLRPRRGRVAALGVLAVVAVLPLAWVSIAEGAAPPAEELSTGGTLTAGSATLTGLAYDGTLTVPTTAGDTQVLEMTSTSATLTDLALHVPCTAVPRLGTGLASDLTTGAGSTAKAPAGLTFYATSVSGTAGGTQTTWTPASPPPAAQLGDVTLTGLVVDFAGIEAPSLTVPGVAQATSFCTP